MPTTMFQTISSFLKNPYETLLQKGCFFKQEGQQINRGLFQLVCVISHSEGQVVGCEPKTIVFAKYLILQAIYS
jgi:hypothetical protein